MGENLRFFFNNQDVRKTATDREKCHADYDKHGFKEHDICLVIDIGCMRDERNVRFIGLDSKETFRSRNYASYVLESRVSVFDDKNMINAT